MLSAAKELERLYLNENRNFGQVRLNGISVFDQQGGARKGLLFFAILSVVVGLVLLIACANVAGLLAAGRSPSGWPSAGRGHGWYGSSLPRAPCWQ
jgi:hypothetical protein